METGNFVELAVLMMVRAIVCAQKAIWSEVSALVCLDKEGHVQTSLLCYYPVVLVPLMHSKSFQLFFS
jgi:hypothetical protein